MTDITSADTANRQIAKSETGQSIRLPEGQAIAKINLELAKPNSPAGFLPAAENTLIATSDDFTGKLGVRAIEIARDRKGTAVDQRDVEDADKILRGDVSADRKVWLLGIAGFTGGAAIAAIVAVLLASDPVKDVQYWRLAIALLFACTVILFIISFPRRKKA